MKDTSHHDERIANMTFASVYPHYVDKVEKMGKSKEELHKVINWLTGFSEEKLAQLIEDEITFEGFFNEADLNPNAHLIKGVICGYRVEEIENPQLKKRGISTSLLMNWPEGKRWRAS